jgi:hypothetical protein
VGPSGILVHNVYNKCTGQSVYILYDETTKQIKYIGRGDHIVRLARHAKDPVKGGLQPVVLYKHNLTKAQAKGLEHRLIEHFGGTIKNNPGTQLLNKYAGIGAKNPNKATYLRVSKQLFEEAIKKIKSLGLH